MKIISRFLLVYLLMYSNLFAHQTALANHPSIIAGFLHPLMGLDHQLVMISIGFWSVQKGYKPWLGPTLFVSFMILGSILALNQFALPFLEMGISLSVLFMGLFIATAFRSYVNLSFVAICIFAIFHGHAHGGEIPLAASSLPYISGFTLSTILLHILGMGFSYLFKKMDTAPIFSRVAGTGVALTGIYLILSHH